MECNKWEEAGLLFTSDELDALQKEHFLNHTQNCSSCSSELTLYTTEKKKFFSAEIFCEQTSEELDKKILALCASSKPTNTGVMGAVWIRRVVLSSLVFALGAGAGGYFTFAYYKTKSDAAIAQVKSSSATVATAPTTEKQATTLASTDSAKNATGTFAAQKGPRTEGVVPSQGMITVDLKKE